MKCKDCKTILDIECEHEFSDTIITEYVSCNCGNTYNRIIVKDKHGHIIKDNLERTNEGKITN